MKWMVVVAGLSSAVVAHADVPIEIAAQAGLRHWRMHPGVDYFSDLDSVDGNDPSIAVLVGYRATPQLAIGGRLGAAYEHYTDELDADFGVTTTARFSNFVAEPAVAALLTHDRLWFTFWVGARIVREHGVASACGRGIITCTDSPRTTYPAPRFAFGTSGGIDLVKLGASRIGLVVDLEIAGREYLAAGLGVAFRR